MKLELNPEETVALLRLLDAWLPELRWETARSEDHEYRRGMEAEEALLTRIREALAIAVDWDRAHGAPERTGLEGDPLDAPPHLLPQH
jgi:hypothetical protein